MLVVVLLEEVNDINIKESYLESSGGVVVRALASHQCGPGFDSQTRRHMWVEFVGSLLCSESFVPRVLRFSPLLKNLTLI